MTQEVFFKRYSIDFDNGWLGEGTFGTVYKAYDNTYSTWKAIKISKVRFIDGKKFSLISEFEATQALPPHVNIANYEAVYQYQMANGMFDYAIMQFYNEGNLKQLLQNNILVNSQKTELVDGLLEGISYLHEHKIIHRDIKPSNIMIVKDPMGKFIPKIADFGLSRFVDNDASFMTNSFGGGTLEYSSPEQLYCKPLKYNSDLWSFGVITFELFAGVRPFGAEDDGNTEAKRLLIYQKIVKAELPTTLDLIPEPYQQVVKKCLVKDANERINSGAELINYIQRYKSNDLTPGQDDEKTYILTKEEKAAYENALGSYKVIDSENFLRAYPESIFNFEITEHLKKLKDQNKAKQVEINRKNKISEQEDFDIITKRNDIRSYKWFIKQYPGSKFNNEIYLKIEEFKKQKHLLLFKQLKRFSFILILPILYFLYSFYVKISAVTIYEKAGKYGIISELKGNISAPIYDNIKVFKKDQFIVSQFKRKFIIDKNGDFISEYPPKESQIKPPINDPLKKEWVLKANLNELKFAKNKYPTSKYISLIDYRIAAINEKESEKLFKKIRASNNINELQGFLTKYPDVKKSENVKLQLLEITKGYSETQLFTAAKQSYSIVLYKRYLENYPSGEHVSEVRDAIRELEISSKELSQ